MRVLYVDDDRVGALLFSETCRSVDARLEVECAISGAEALELLAEWAPDALVIDLHLPDTTGHALLPALRQRAARPDLPAWLCTADEAEHAAGPAHAAGFDGCWTKPVEATDIAMLLQRLPAPGAGS